MLRHLRMTPTTKEIPKADGRIFGLLQDWISPFYRYRIPHTPTPRDRVCTCAYPLFTLRSSQRSPYDEPTILGGVLETVYVDNTGKSTSPLASEVHGSAAPGMQNTSTATACASASASSTDATTTTAGPSSNLADAAATLSFSPAAAAAPSSPPASAFLSSFGNLPSLKTRWAVRRRRGGRLTAVPHSSETCYRCDICDGLQRSADEREAERDGSKAGDSGAATAMTAVDVKAWKEEVLDEDEENDEQRYGYTTSTDIANTAMEDAEVAELRHLDPFHVEVFGKPSWGALLKRAALEVQGQFNRCGLQKRDASRYAAQATANSDISRQTYRLWVRGEVQRVREEQRRSMQPTPSTAFTTSSSSSDMGSTAALTLSSEQQAIVKGKLDTLHIAAYLARYAVAAYGLPYELNFFTSVRELTKLMAEPHSRYVCANSEEQLESMRRMLQGKEPDALLECVASRYSLRVGQPCWSLFLDHAAQRVILSFRGSLTAADMVVDIMEGYANVMLEHTSHGGQGSSSAAASHPQRVCTAIPLGFYNSVVEAGVQLLPILRTIHAQYGGYALCVTGHSLGGIEASIFHLLYCGPWKAVPLSSSSLMRRTKGLRCPSTVDGEAPAVTESSVESKGSGHVPFTKTVTCTFAAAPVIEKRVVAVVNAWLEEEEKRTGSRLVAMTHGVDFVTRLQVHSLKETFLKSYSVASTATTTATDDVGSQKPSESDQQGTITTTTATPSSPEKLDVATVSDKSVIPILAVPGSMYNMTAGTRRRHLLAVPLSATAVREQVTVSAEAVLQHFPCLYLRSLTELLNRYEAKWSSLRAAAPQSSLASAAFAATAALTGKSE